MPQGALGATAASLMANASVQRAGAAIDERLLAAVSTRFGKPAVVEGVADPLVTRAEFTEASVALAEMIAANAAVVERGQLRLFRIGVAVVALQIAIFATLLLR